MLTNEQRKLLKSEHYFNRYQKWINEYQFREKPDKGEYHHIIPKCIGGTDELSNILFLGYREHYITHYILAKSFSHKGLWFSFNIMRRVSKGKSVLYESARKYISKTISESNTGRKRTEKFKQDVSKELRIKL